MSIQKNVASYPTRHLHAIANLFFLLSFTRLVMGVEYRHLFPIWEGQILIAWNVPMRKLTPLNYFTTLHLSPYRGSFPFKSRLIVTIRDSLHCIISHFQDFGTLPETLLNNLVQLSDTSSMMQSNQKHTLLLIILSKDLAIWRICIIITNGWLVSNFSSPPPPNHPSPYPSLWALSWHIFFEKYICAMYPNPVLNVALF